MSKRQRCVACRYAEYIDHSRLCRSTKCGISRTNEKHNNIVFACLDGLDLVYTAGVFVSMKQHSDKATFVVRSQLLYPNIGLTSAVQAVSCSLLGQQHPANQVLSLLLLVLHPLEDALDGQMIL